MSQGALWLRSEALEGQVPIARVIAALRALDSDEVWLLGADGFTAPSHPSLDFILDLSDLPEGATARESIRLGLAALIEWPDDLFVELVMR